MESRVEVQRIGTGLHPFTTAAARKPRFYLLPITCSALDGCFFGKRLAPVFVCSSRRVWLFVGENKSSKANLGGKVESG
jgi:hypothetical protein